MKRRVEEISFNPNRPLVGGGGGVGLQSSGGVNTSSSAAAAAAAAVLSNAQHRVLSTQNVTQTSNIQYQVNPGVLKVTSVQVNSNNNNNNSTGGSGGSGNVTSLGGSGSNSSSVDVINNCATILGGSAGGVGGQNSQAVSGGQQFGSK